MAHCITGGRRLWRIRASVGRGGVIVRTRYWLGFGRPQLHFDVRVRARKTGRVAAGPPPHPLTRYPVRVENGLVEIRTDPIPIG